MTRVSLLRTAGSALFLDRFLGLFLLGVVVSTSGAALAPPPADGDRAVNLTGTWLRDEAESDDVDEKAEASRAADPRAQSGVTFGRGGGTGRPGNRPAGSSRRARSQDPIAGLARAVEVLQIEHQAPQLTVTNAHRETRVVFTDGRTIGDGLGSETLAHWSGDTLVIESKSESDKRVERYRLESPERLVVETEIQHSPRPQDDGLASGPRGSRSGGASGGGFPRGQGQAPPPAVGAPGSRPQPAINFQFRTVYERIDKGERHTPTHATPAAASPTESTSAGAATVGSDRPVDPTTLALPEVAANRNDPDKRDEWYRPGAATIRILPPALRPGEASSGKIEIQTLSVSPAVEIVEFHLDGEQVARKSVPPFDAMVDLAAPAREQTLEVVAFDGRGNRLGADQLILNRLDPPFRVRITGLATTASPGASGNIEVRVDARVSVPRKAHLETVEIYRNETQVDDTGTLLETLEGAAVQAKVAFSDITPRDFVRVVARLRDGRELEDVQLIEGFEFGESIEVHLVQLQVLVTDKYGSPITELSKDDLEVLDGGEKRVIDRLYPSANVALNLGLSIDSSGSMRDIWQQTRGAAEQFLDQSLGERDRAFLVDFDSQLRLLQPLTGDKRDLFRALGLLEPEGNTALYDSILFSLLQFTAEPGRRALIVFTDGFDSGSKSDPKRAIEFGQQLGVPVYIIALANQRGGIAPSRGGVAGNNPAMAEAVARGNLKLITGPTGGRLFQVLNFEQVVDAFAQISKELRSQYVLTYYSDRAPGQGGLPKVKALIKGARVRTALPLDLAD